MAEPVQVILFNGQPVIPVRRRRDGVYEWVTIKHGVMQHSLKREVKNFMSRHGYKCYFEDEQ